MVQELIIMAAAVTSYETLLESLIESSKEYLLTESKETLKKIQFHCAVLMAKEIVEQKGAEGVLQEMKDFSKMEKLLNPNKN